MAELISGNLSSSPKHYHMSGSLIPHTKWWYNTLRDVRVYENTFPHVSEMSIAQKIL